MEQIVEENRTETNKKVCHWHDFLDFNMVPHRVFLRYSTDAADEGGIDRWTNLRNEIWNCTKARNLLIFKRGDVVEIFEEFQDLGDATITWVVQDYDEKGSVDLVPFEMAGAIKSMYVVKVESTRLKHTRSH